MLPVGKEYLKVGVMATLGLMRNPTHRKERDEWGTLLGLVFKVETTDKEEERKQSHWQEDDKPEVRVHHMTNPAVIEAVVGKHQQAQSQTGY
jgi:hypothetical protein